MSSRWLANFHQIIWSHKVRIGSSAKSQIAGKRSLRFGSSGSDGCPVGTPFRWCRCVAMSRGYITARAQTSARERNPCDQRLSFARNGRIASEDHLLSRTPLIVTPPGLMYQARRVLILDPQNPPFEALFGPPDTPKKWLKY